MPRNYILKLEEVEFDENSNILTGGITASSDFNFGDMTGSVLEIGGEKFLFASSDEEGTGVLYDFTRDGVLPTEEPEEFASVSHDSIVVPGEDTTFSVSFSCKISKYPVSGAPYTLPVYLYTGEDDPDPTSRNFSFSDHSRNDVDGIDNLMDALLGNEEA